MLADGQRSNEEIAARVGVTASALIRWRRESPEFRARIDEHVAAFRKRITSEGLATKENRIALSKSRAAAIRGVIRARGQLESMQSAPGDSIIQKGIQCLEIRSIGSGDLAREVEEYRIDTGTLAEERACMRQIAIEMGDWKSRSVIQVEGPSIVEILRDRRLRRAHCEAEDAALDAAAAAAAALAQRAASDTDTGD